jgi:hypothetical protein
VDVEKIVSQKELDNPNKRITRVYCNNTTQLLYNGKYSGAPVEQGQLAIRWNTGELEVL